MDTIWEFHETPLGPRPIHPIRNGRMPARRNSRLRHQNAGQGRPRIVILGGGFTGVSCAKALEDLLAGTAAEIMIVNPENFMLYTPRLPEAASGAIEPRHCVVPLRQALRRCRVVVGRCVEVDVSARTLIVRRYEGAHQALAWDRLVVAVGSVSRPAPVPGLAEDGHSFKSLGEAIHLSNHVLRQLELADSAMDPQERAERLTFVVAGGGFAGTELVGEIQALTARAIASYPRLRREDLRWVLVEMAESLLAGLGNRLARRAAQELTRRGVEIRTARSVSEVGPTCVRLSDGEVLATRIFVWTAGVRPAPVDAGLGAACDAGGRILVDEYLAVEGLLDTFAVGDAAAVPDRTGRRAAAPMTAQYGVREGRACAVNVAASLRMGAPRAFRYRERGLLVNIGGYRGVGRLWRLPSAASPGGALRVTTTCSPCRPGPGGSGWPSTGRSGSSFPGSTSQILTELSRRKRGG
jgi:NADH dehydrogenase